MILTLTSCGGEGIETTPASTGNGQIGQFSGFTGKTSVLRAIIIIPGNLLGINAGTQFNLTARGYFTDNSVQDLTTMVTWISSDTSIVTVNNTQGSKGQAMAVSKGYCSISATLSGISETIIIGIN